ncbi:MAG: nucleotidyltransferase domain-containing protein [Deltaproteobacteria bacterium]|nr:nucleotidyltransferase domain-containing protein [Deltaproteobacteria bacterium]
MAQIPNQIRDIIDKYIRALEKERIHVQRAVLFGSHAYGKADQWSDIDIALVSDAFEGDRFDDRSKIRRITLSVSSDLSPLPFRPEDFVPENPFVKEILEKGVTIL